MTNLPSSTNVLISEYDEAVAPTDQFKQSEMTPILLGLFGEVGSVMSTSKKLHREKEAFPGYLRDVEEELGDTLWYVAALCRRLGLSLSVVFSDVLGRGNFCSTVAAISDIGNPIARIMSTKDLATLDEILLRLGNEAARMLSIESDRSSANSVILDFVQVYLEVVQASQVSFAAVLTGNIAKARGRFVKASPGDLPDFDATFDVEEQLPREFEIWITQRADGRSYLRWNGVFIGDPLSDSIADRDGYRFHDVFHFANAAILHWSPIFRSLIKHKRKSKQQVDEAQDGGRAKVVEEGVSAYVFSYAKSLKYFAGQDSVSFDLLKTIHKSVQGYEVEACPLQLWEDAILQGYRVFREMRKHNGGIVVGDRHNRTLQYRAIED